jgi:hypothetical protein
MGMNKREQCGARRSARAGGSLMSCARMPQREERKPDMGRLAAVASAVAQNPCLQGSATIAARPAAAAAPSAHAPAEASATSSDSEAGAERDLTYDEVNSKVQPDPEQPPDCRSVLRSNISPPETIAAHVCRFSVRVPQVVFKLNILSKSALLATLVCGGAVLFNSRVRAHQLCSWGGPSPGNPLSPDEGLAPRRA